MGFLSFFAKKKHFSSPTHTLSTRAPRVTLVPLHHISFDIHAPITCADITIGNISASGIGFFRESIGDVPPNDTIINGTLFLQKNPIDVQLKVVHSNTNIVGCIFTTLPDNFATTLAHYFRVELSAMELDRIAKEYLKKENDGEALWFRGSDNCELYTVVSEDKIIRFTLSFFGNLIEYRTNNPVRYSQTGQEEFGLKMKGSELIRHEMAVPKEIGESSIKFVMNIKNLAAKKRDFICGVIEEAITPEDETKVNS